MMQRIDPSALFLPPKGKRLVRWSIAALSVCSVGTVGVALARNAPHTPFAPLLASKAANAGFDASSSGALLAGDTCAGEGKTVHLLYNNKGGYTKTGVIRTASYREGAAQEPEEEFLDGQTTPLTTLGVIVGQSVSFKTTVPLDALTEAEQAANFANPPAAQNNPPTPEEEGNVVSFNGDQPEGEASGPIPPGYLFTSPGTLDLQKDRGRWEASWGTVKVVGDTIIYTAPAVQPYGGLDTISYTGPDGSETDVTIYVTVNLDPNLPAPEETGVNAPVTLEVANANDLALDASEAALPVQEQIEPEPMEGGWKIPVSITTGSDVKLYVPAGQSAPQVIERWGPVNPVPNYILGAGYAPPRPGGPSPNPPPPPPILVPPCREGEVTQVASTWQGDPPYSTGWSTIGSLSINVTAQMKQQVQSQYSIDLKLGAQLFTGVQVRSFVYSATHYTDYFECKKNNLGKLIWAYKETRTCRRTGDGRLFSPTYMAILMGWPEAGNPKWKNPTCRNGKRNTGPFNPAPPNPGTPLP